MVSDRRQNRESLMALEALEEIEIIGRFYLICDIVRRSDSIELKLEDYPYKIRIVESDCEFDEEGNIVRWRKLPNVLGM